MEPITAAPPPMTNRGVEMSGLSTNPAFVTAGLGWLDGSAKSPAPEEVKAVIEGRFGSGFEVPPSGWFGAAQAYRDGFVRVEWDGRAGAAGVTRAEVKQTALDELGLAGSVELVRDLVAAGYRPSRVDCWVDDRLRRMTPRKVRRAVLDGQAVTHARPGRYWRDDLDGRETYYLGRPGSDRMARCYDRENDVCRMEVQTRREAAVHAAGVVMAAQSSAGAVASNVISFVDFRESKVRSDGRRRPRLPWWHAVVGDLARAEAAPSRPRPSLEELAEYFRQYWSKPFAELFLAYGSGWVNSVLEEGMSKLGQEDAREVA